MLTDFRIADNINMALQKTIKDKFDCNFIFVLKNNHSYCNFYPELLCLLLSSKIFMKSSSILGLDNGFPTRIT